MKEIAVEEATATFQQLEQWFISSVRPENGITGYYDALPDDAVLVTIDCHD